MSLWHGAMIELWWGILFASGHLVPWLLVPKPPAGFSHPSGSNCVLSPRPPTLESECLFSQMKAQAERPELLHRTACSSEKLFSCEYI